ncbi:hypothetical protein ACIBG0_13785 [Nocardia sp. NPDC050630]|uniref:hypothetical protein n=1 Tax=Nocardia sp. NPDC050630 TaxID=3364321 RepID=UPI00378A209B
MGIFRSRRRRKRGVVAESATEVGGDAAMELLAPGLARATVGGIRGVIGVIANLLS